MALKHATTSAAVDNPAYDVSSGEWNADHTVDDNTLAPAKLAVAATSRVIGRKTAGAGAGEELTAADLKTILAIASTDVSGLAAIATSGSATDLGSGTVPAGRMPALMGDVTTSAGAVATTIAARAVTYAKMQAVSATSRILGRITAGAGDVEELTAANLKTIAGYYTSGDSPTFAAITGTGAMDLSGAAAGQIAFPATQNAAAGANTLDDYEEGTFTPALAFVTPGTSSWAITSQLGWYTKIGNCVTYSLFYSGVPTNGTASGNLNLTGLPFTAKATTNEHHANAIEIGGYTKASFTAVCLRILQGTTTAEFRASGTGQATTALAVADIPTGGSVIIRSSGVFFTA